MARDTSWIITKAIFVNRFPLNDYYDKPELVTG